MSLPHVQLWNKLSFETNIWPTRSSEMLNRWPLSITATSTGMSVLFESRYFPQARSTDQIRNAIIADSYAKAKSRNGMGYQYENVHVHIIFVTIVVAKKAGTHPSIESAWASGEALLKDIMVPTPVTKLGQVRYRLLWTHNILTSTRYPKQDR